MVQEPPVRFHVTWEGILHWTAILFQDLHELVAISLRPSPGEPSTAAIKQSALALTSGFPESKAAKARERSDIW